MVKEDTGAPNEDATSDWMAADEAVGCFLCLNTSASKFASAFDEMGGGEGADDERVTFGHGIIFEQDASFGRSATVF
ncbi:hypothetical protein TNCV_1445361 [Trichonephila clavipes]|nr:hypothetical protein TNCV_1445361 [Trichonephila clavipes]